jgi:hypothetical protein
LNMNCSCSIPGGGLTILVDLDSREQMFDVYVLTLARNADLRGRWEMGLQTLYVDYFSKRTAM